LIRTQDARARHHQPGPHRRAAGRADRARGGLPELTLEFWPACWRRPARRRDRPASSMRLNGPPCGAAEMKQAMAKLGFDAKIGSPQDFAAFIAEEIPRWAEIVIRPA